MKIFFGTMAAAVVLISMTAQPAQARCWWSGYGWTCSDHQERFIGRDRFDRRDRVEQFDRFGERFDRRQFDRRQIDPRQNFYGGGYEHQNSRWGY